jgi:aminoglycoside phosphotransferase (APT) family kinase protein
MLELIAQRLGLRFTDVEPAHDGQGRTFFARVAGDAVVVKWGIDPDLPEKLPYVASQVPELLRRNCPVPRFLAYGPLGGGRYGWVQGRLAGTPARVLDEALLGDLVDLIARLAGAPAGPHRNDMGYWVPAVVFEDIAGWWQTAAAMAPDAAAFCRRLRAWTGSPRETSRRDYVHGDLNLSNVLVTGGRLTGIVDTEILGVGDSAIDLARLAFEWYRLARAGTPGLAPNALARLAALAHDLSGDAAWRVAVAYELISNLGWRSDHDTQPDPYALLPACANFLTAIE